MKIVFTAAVPIRKLAKYYRVKHLRGNYWLISRYNKKRFNFLWDIWKGAW